jgi:hypothetical protein
LSQIHFYIPILISAVFLVGFAVKGMKSEALGDVKIGVFPFFALKTGCRRWNGGHRV